VLNLLVIAEAGEDADAIKGLLPEHRFKVSARACAAEARTVLEAGIFDVCAVIAGKAGLRAEAEIAAIKGYAPACRLLALIPPEENGTKRPRLIGADAVLKWPSENGDLESAVLQLAATGLEASPQVGSRPAEERPPSAKLGLENLRECSRVLSHSLDYRAFTEQFAEKLREIAGVARIAIFLESPPSDTAAGAAAAANGRMSCVAAFGIPREILECFELTRSAGLGLRLSRSPQAIRISDGPAGQGDSRCHRELEILGCEVALPVHDRERSIGVATFGSRMAGGDFSAEELQLLFLLMEELGAAIRNSWLHRQLANSHQLLSDALAAMTSGSMIVGSDLSILHVNRAMVRFLKGPGFWRQKLDFAELPGQLAVPIHQMVEQGANSAPFFFSNPAPAAEVYRVSIIPIGGAGQRLPQPAMVILEDFTQIEAARKADIESSKGKLVALIAKRVAHEIRNALVPLTTYHQLIDDAYDQPEFRDSLKEALGRETARIQRFTEQMLLLTHPQLSGEESLDLAELIRKSFARAQVALGRAEAELTLEEPDPPALINGHRHSLLHALQEIFLNSMLAAPDDTQVTARIECSEGNEVRISFRDSGPGFTAETAQRAREPFFTARNTGIGLGLTVAGKIIEDHGGRLDIYPRFARRDEDLTITLPLST
jgi:signal transduction histidine kinase